MNDERVNKTEASLKNIPEEINQQDDSMSGSLKIQFVKLQKFGFPENAISSINQPTREAKNKTNLTKISKMTYQGELELNYNNAFSGIIKI